MASATPPQPPIVQEGQNDPLATLRDIHLPSAVDTLPNALGWWILSGLIIGIVAYGIYKLFKYWRSNQYRRDAAADLSLLQAEYQQSQDARHYLLALNDLLKRTALTQYPRPLVASLSGEAWVAFLDKSAATQEFSMGAGQCLIEGPYQALEVQNGDIESLHKLCNHWIKSHLSTARLANQQPTEIIEASQ